MRIALGIEYDGAGFHGWQSQRDGATVQDVLEKALAAVAGTPIRCTCAGRTDAGVHALGQVVHIDTDVERPVTAWVRGVNAHLPPSVAVLWAQPVNEGFHARFSARSRSYRYLLLNRAVRPALGAARMAWYHQPLDVAAMRAGTACLLGEHDFSAFRAAECQARTPIKIMHHVDIRRQNDVIVFDMTASAFLHHMVRNLVGSLVYVGSGRQRPEWIGELLASRDRSRAAPTFSPAGLYFVGVEYDRVWQLPGGGLMMPVSPLPTCCP